MRTTAKLIMIVAAATAIAGSRVSAAQATSITVKLYGCRYFPGALPSISTATSYEARFTPVTISPRKLAADLFQFDLPSPQRHFWIKGDFGECHTRVPVTVATGHRRSILLFPSNNRFPATSGRHWLAGCLADGVTSIVLTTPSHTPLVAANIDDGCYYFEYLENAKYLIRLQPSPGIFIDVPVTISGGGESGTMLNITSNELLRYLHS
jgi:hypothetical protein